MDTQGLQLDVPETHAPQQVRSKKMVPLIAGAAVMVILAAIGVYYVAFRSLPTTVSWAPSVSAIAPGGDLTVSGRVAPAEIGRLISFESAPKAQGPWTPIPQSAATDSGGRFTITYKPQLTGSIVMRVTVDPAGRYLAVTGKSMPVKLLTLSSISLTGGGATATQTPLKFTVAVDPPSVGRTIRIEQSSDKVRWVLVGPSAKTKADGTSALSVPAPAVGAWSYRATALQDENFASSVSPVVGATVEDIKAAAATYIRITYAYNTAVDVFNKTLDKATGSTVVPKYAQAAAQVLSAADTTAATNLRAYGSWPQSVKPQIDQIIAQYVTEADNMHQLSAVTSVSSWSTVMSQGDAASTEGARLSTLIRQALGLPQRKAG